MCNSSVSASYQCISMWVFWGCSHSHYADGLVCICSNSTTPDTTLRYNWRMPLWSSHVTRTLRNTSQELCIMYVSCALNSCSAVTNCLSHVASYLCQLLFELKSSCSTLAYILAMLHFNNHAAFQIHTLCCAVMLCMHVGGSQIVDWPGACMQKL